MRLRWPRFSGRPLEKVLSTDVSLARRLCGAASRSRLSRCVLSRCVLLTLFRYTQVSWEGQLGQVDTPNPRTVRNWGWRLTGVCEKSISFSYFIIVWHLDLHFISLKLRIIRIDILKKYTIILYCDIKYVPSARQLLQLFNFEFVKIFKEKKSYFPAGKWHSVDCETAIYVSRRTIRNAIAIGHYYLQKYSPSMWHDAV